MIRVLDTSAVSAVMRREPGAIGRLAALRPDDLLLCAPVAAEIRFGIERLPPSRRRTLLEAEYTRLRSVRPWSDWTERVAAAFGSLKAGLEREGTPVTDMDIVVGSIAVAMDGVVATLNVRDFQKMAGLPVEDWSKGL